MKKTLLNNTIACLLALVIVLCSSVAGTAQTQPGGKGDILLIHNLHIVDVRSGKITRNKAILIVGNRISAIGDFADLQRNHKDAVQVDCGNRFAIPGLWDMHVHIEGADLVEDNLALFPVYIAHGITTLRDAASDLGVQVLAWRDEVNRGTLFAPRIFTAGIKLEGINSIWKGDMEIANEEDLAVKLDSLVYYKVDFIKITENTLSGELFLKSVLAARKAGFKVSGHVPIDLSIRALANAGFSSIEHASYLLRLGSDEERIAHAVKTGTMARTEASRIYVDSFNQQKAVLGFRELAQKKVAVCPTLIGSRQLAYLDLDNHQQDEYQQYLTKRFKANYDWRIKRQAGETREQMQRRKYTYELVKKQLPHIQSSGMMILAGTDAAALNSFVYPGLALHQELEIFQDAGLSPLSILQSATINGASFMGVADSLGVIEAGHIADIVILNENPLIDIRATQGIFSVIKNGDYYDRRSLDAMLDAARKKSAELDAKRGE